MFKKPAFLLALVAAMSFFGSACAPPADNSDLKGALAEIQAQQKDLLEKVDSLAKGQKEVLVKATAAAAAKPAAAPAQPKEDPNKIYAVEVGNSAFKGPADAKVTLIEFSDFQCPFCSQAAKLIDQILEAYPDDVRFSYKNYPLPFHNQAMPAAKAAVAAGKQGKFFEMHDLLFENFRTLSEEKFIEFAGTIGIDVEQFKTDLASPDVAAQVTAEMDEAGKNGVRGTPTVFINGKKPSGRSFELYKSIIDAEIKAKS
jgi:protein-disulfide isomerase